MRELSRPVLIALCGACGAFAAACASYAPPPSHEAMAYELVGTHWVAASINGAPVAGAAKPQISFSPEYQLSGSGGCNALFGVYEADNDHIDVRGLGHTQRACAAPVMAQETAFLGILKDANRYDRDQGRLVITAEDGRSVTFESASG